MRLTSSIMAVKSKAPSLGGSFAVWGGLYSGFDCTFAWMRGKEDFKNSIMSGAATGAVLAARSGWKGSLRSGLVGGGLLALIEGVIFVVSRQAPDPGLNYNYTNPPAEDVLEPQPSRWDWLKWRKQKQPQEQPLGVEEEFIYEPEAQVKEADAGARALADLLRTNAKLRELLLGLNQITDVGARALADGLSANRALRKLNLTFNPLSPDGAAALAAVCRSNPLLSDVLLNAVPGSFDIQNLAATG